MDDIYTPNKSLEATKVFGDDDSAHPAVFYLHNTVKDFYIGGKVQAIQPPTHFDYVPLRCGQSLLLSMLFDGLTPLNSYAD